MNKFPYPPTGEFCEVTLLDAIKGIARAVAVTLELSKTNYVDYRHAAIEAFRQCPDRPEILVADRFPDVTKDQERRLFLAKAYIHAMLADLALKAEDRDLAWNRVSAAHRELGRFDGSYYDPSSSREREDFAASGGRGHGDRNVPVREQLIRLLNERRPKNGWAKPKDVIDALKPELLDVIRVSGSFLTESGLPQAIRRWLRTHQDIRTAFEGLHG